MEFEHDWVNYPELTNTQLQEMQFMSPHPQIIEDFVATVVKVHDGDTMSLSCEFRDFVFPLRMADIDAPELNAGGAEARDWLINKVEKQEVQIMIDPKNRVEKYGRLLGRVFYRGMDIGQEEIYLNLVQPFGRKLEGELPLVEKTFAVKQWF